MHGRPRQPLAAADPAREKHEQTKIAHLESLLAEVLRNHHDRCYSKKALQQNAQLLEINPEVFTAWNYRKSAVNHLLESAQDDISRRMILEEELQVVERALKRNYKSYGAWYHRKWVIKYGLCSLDHEFQLLDKFLAADDRNFHGWDYRRFAVRVKKVPEEEEWNYTTKKINENFSNYSAWHNRSALLSQLFKDKFSERRMEILTEEYELVQQAFFTEPEDQSGWFYHMWLLGQTVAPFGPRLIGCWPSSGSMVTIEPSGPSVPFVWGFKTPFEEHLCQLSKGLFAVLCFSEPVLGVNSETVRIKSTPEICDLSDTFWRPLSLSTGGSRTWDTEIVVPSMDFENDKIICLEVEVGGVPGIISQNGHTFLGTSQLSFILKMRSTSDAPYCDENLAHSSIDWPVETPIPNETFSSGQRHFDENRNMGLQSKPFSTSETGAEWQFKTLERQISTCRELLHLEGDSKWGKLTLARLLMAYDNLLTGPHDSGQNTVEVLQLFEDLVSVDPSHAQYYNEQFSLLRLDQVTCDSEKLHRHWWENASKVQSPNECGGKGWLRLHSLSLSKLGYFERLIWVQRLDLSYNKLQCLEGLEPLQQLLFLDVSHNLIHNWTVLGPLRLIRSLQALNIAHNEIGAHSIDTSRYSFPSGLCHMPDIDKAEGTEDAGYTILGSWEIGAVFKGMGLRQLEIFGNPIANDSVCRKHLIQALPSLIWLDGVKVS